MSFELFKCFISLQAIWWPNVIKFWHSKDSGPVGKYLILVGAVHRKTVLLKGI